MISGKVALGGLTVEFGNAKRAFEDLVAEVDALTRAQSKLLDEERRLLEELARVYLPELSREAIESGLRELKGRLEAALAKQEAHRRELEASLRTLPEDIARHELLLAEAERVEERAAAALDTIRGRVEDELGGDDSHADAVAEHRRLMERRSIVKARRSRLQTTANVARHDYEGDRAFTYLLGRDFLEPEYRGGFLTRRLDAWLARRIDFETLYRNYRILRTGPHQMRSEIRAVTERAAALERAIDAQESEVADRLGLTAALEAEAAAQRALVDARETLADSRARHDRLAAEIRAVDANRGRPYEEAVSMYRAFLEERSDHELRSIAGSTADPKDDDLAARIRQVRERMDTIGRKLVPLRKELERRARGTMKVGDLARRAMASFSSRRSLFPDGFDLEDIVESILEGDFDLDDAFERIRSAHVKRPLLTPRGSGDFDGWFAELSSEYDHELGAVQVRVDEDAEIDSEVVVYDHHGRVLHRRVTRRGESRADGRRPDRRDGEGDRRRERGRRGEGRGDRPGRRDERRGRDDRRRHDRD